jgi:N-acetylglucosaminyldiphosphoundecaprenol N-acetyl-beta-D-mannosaminyltransferase
VPESVDVYASGAMFAGMDLTLGGARAHALSSDDFMSELRRRWAAGDGRPLAVASANLDHIHHFGQGSSYETALEHAPIDWLVTLDGMPCVWWARHITGSHWPQLAGSDHLLPVLLQAADDGVRVGFLGGQPQMHDRLLPVLGRDVASLKVVGMWAPDRRTLTDDAASADLATRIRSTDVELLVVGLGKPRQELWIAQHLPASGARVALAFGASADFVAGTAQRAPTRWRRFGFEWAFRLHREPRRLWRRYLLQGPRALWCLIRYSAVDGRGRTVGEATIREPN